MSLVHAALSLPIPGGAANSARDTEVVSVRAGTNGVTERDLAIIADRLTRPSAGW